MKNITVGLVIFFFGLVAFSNVYAQDKSEKMAFINLSKVFDEYKKTQKYDKELEEKGQGKIAEREKKVKEIKDLQDKLSVLSKTEKEKTESKIDEKMKGLQQFDSNMQTDLRIERDNMLKEILKEIEKVIKEYAEKNKITLILNDRILLYGDKTLDVTDDIVKILNDRYKQ